MPDFCKMYERFLTIFSSLLTNFLQLYSKFSLFLKFPIPFPSFPNRLLYEKSSSLMSNCLYVPLINIQLLSIYNADYWQLKNLIIITSLTLSLFIVIEKCWKLFLDVFLTTQCVLLMFLSMRFDDENFWLHSLTILIFLNYFGIPELTRRYSVPKQELLSISLIFQNIFLVNSLFWGFFGGVVVVAGC